MLQKILLYLKQCPILETLPMTADFLGEEDGAVGVFAVGSDPVLEQYADGGKLKQFIFKILARGSNHSLIRGELTAISDVVGRFLEVSGVMPELSGGQTPQSIKVIKTGEVTGRRPGSFCQEMVCRMVYYEEKGCDR